MSQLEERLENAITDTEAQIDGQDPETDEFSAIFTPVLDTLCDVRDKVLPAITALVDSGDDTGCDGVVVVDAEAFATLAALLK